MLALAVQQTRRIGLGPGVLVPTLRHPMVNASGAAMLSALAPGRVAVAFGTGFNGTRALGASPATWSYLKNYVHTFRALLRAETVEWDRRPIRMLHPADHAPVRPIELTVLISALGPKELAITHEIADGLFSVNNQTSHAREFPWATLGIHGTVVEDNEPLDSARVRAAAGPGLALAYRATYEFGGDVTQLPGGQNWLKVINAQPNATSQCTTNTSSDSTRPTKQRGPPGVGELSPPRPSPGRLRASPNNSPTTSIKASPKSSTNPRGPTSPASSNALSPSPKKPNRHFNREEWS
jgi:hypothetical protein